MILGTFGFLTFWLGSPVLPCLLFVPPSRVRTILQNRDLLRNPKVPPISGMLDCVKKICQTDGFSGLWRSGSAFYFSVVTNIALNFFIIFILASSSIKVQKKSDDLVQEENESLESTSGDTGDTKSTDSKQNNIENDFTNYLALLRLAPLVGQIILHPLEVIRVKMSCDMGNSITRQYSGFFDTVEGVVKRGGVKALYRGFVPFSFYCMSNRIADSWREKQNDPGLYAATGFLKAFLIYPPFLISARMIMAIDNPKVRYAGMVDCIRSTLNKFGWRGFYRGFQVTLLFEAIKSIIAIQNRSQRSDLSN